MSKLIVRRAVPADVPALVEMVRALLLESRLSFLPFSEQKVKSVFERLIDANDTCCLFVADREGALIGFVGGKMTYYVFCDEYFAMDQGLYVSPECRGGSAAYRLVAAYHKWARSGGAREVCIAVSTGVKIEATDRLLKGVGMDFVGGVYKLSTGERTSRPCATDANVGANELGFARSPSL
jgi:hypothetical protein